MSFAESVDAFLVNWHDFSDSSPRAEFWWTYLFMLIVNIIMRIGEAMLVHLTPGAMMLGAIIIIIVDIYFFVASVALDVRRFHDVGHSGFNVLWALLPVIGWIILIINYFMPSKYNNNMYQHPDPYYQNAIDSGRYPTYV